MNAEKHGQVTDVEDLFDLGSQRAEMDVAAMLLHALGGGKEHPQGGAADQWHLGEI